MMFALWTCAFALVICVGQSNVFYVRVKIRRAFMPRLAKTAGIEVADRAQYFRIIDFISFVNALMVYHEI
jgi:hypothetical protein